jgi:hypothetical protein
MAWNVKFTIPQHLSSRSWNSELQKLTSDIAASSYANDSLVVEADNIFIITNAKNSLQHMGLNVEPVYYTAL